MVIDNNFLNIHYLINIYILLLYIYIFGDSSIVWKKMKTFMEITKDNSHIHKYKKYIKKKKHRIIKITNNGYY